MGATLVAAHLCRQIIIIYIITKKMLSSQHFCVVHWARSAWSWTGHWAGHYWLSVFWFIFQIYTVDLDNHADYGDKFRSNRDLGIVFWASLIAANLLKEPSLWDTNKLRHKQTETDTSLHWDKQWDINRDTNKLRHKHWETKQWDTNKMNTNKQTNWDTNTEKQNIETQTNWNTHWAVFLFEHKLKIHL